MSTRPATPRSIARWPFVVGDIVLLALALTALLAGGVPPDLGNVVAALICAALGVALLLTPFLLDYEARLRAAEAGARDVAGGQLRRLAQTSEQLANVVSRSQATEEQAGQVLGSLEELAERLAAQSEELSQTLARVADQRQSPAEDVQRLAAETGRRLDALTDAVDRLQKLFEGAVGKTVSDLAAIDRNIHSLEARLNRGSDDSDNGGVAPANKEPSKERFAAPPSGPATTTAVRSSVPRSAKQRGRKRAPKSVPDSAAAPEAETSTSLELALEGSEDKLRTTPAKRAGAPAATALVATAYIGIGNKLFLRGEGAGLSWERGVPMDFLAIGKWGWRSTDANEAVTCRIYRNDDAPMLDADIVIAPGEKSEITPRF